MGINKVYRCLAVASLCIFVFAAGCAQPQRTGIALKPAPGQKDSYKITTYARRNIKWQGAVPKKQAFEESSTEEKVEIGLTQNIQSVAPDGSAQALVTIDSLKYISMIKNHTNIDFDSSRQTDVNSPLANLIGQSYTIICESNNNVTAVLDLTQAQSAVAGTTPTDRAGQNILSPEAIIERHSALTLPAKVKTAKPGESWTSVKTFPFGMMGTKSYEKIYTLREITDQDGHTIAVIDMNAIPTSETEKQYPSPQSKTDFPKMFDTSDTYTGTGQLDLAAGCIVAWRENLQATWVTAFPSDAKTDANEPVVLLMTATRDYSFEKIK